ncbi:MAG: hypothetical protein AAF693_01845 [Bacteroidota bacterium]
MFDIILGVLFIGLGITCIVLSFREDNTRAMDKVRISNLLWGGVGFIILGIHWIFQK